MTLFRYELMQLGRMHNERKREDENMMGSNLTSYLKTRILTK